VVAVVQHVHRADKVSGRIGFEAYALAAKDPDAWRSL